MKYITPIAFALLLGGTLIYADEPKQLSEVSRLKAEILKLNVQLAQCSVTLNESNAKLASSSFATQQKDLEAAFRKELSADEKDTFDWNTFTFTKPSSGTK